MTRKEELLKVLEDDPFGLLKDVKPKVATHQGEEQITLDYFEKITKFFEENGLEPRKSSGEERTLHNVLNSIRKDSEKIALLKPYDSCNLLKDEVKNLDNIEINSLSDMMNNDPFNLLGDDKENDIFTLKHVKKNTNQPEYTAKRKKCKDFEKYKHLFEECRTDLGSGKRRQGQLHSELHIKQGIFFVMGGVLGYVAEMGERKRENKRSNARLKCIFANGTESDMLARSLSAGLYKVDGYLISQVGEEIVDGFSQIGIDDKHDGYIYILESLNTDERIQSVKDLHKIGYSSVSVEERISNAKNEPTYLMAEVKKVAQYKTYNMNTQSFEQLLHKFFGNSCLDIIVTDNEGREHRPREWFVAPLEVIREAARLTINKEIVNYRYDGHMEEIVLKHN